MDLKRYMDNFNLFSERKPTLPSIFSILTELNSY